MQTIRSTRSTLGALAIAIAAALAATGPAQAQSNSGNSGPVSPTAPTTQPSMTPTTPTAPTAQPGATTSRPMSDSKTPMGKSSDSSLAHGDRKFIEMAAAGGLAEVQLGGMAAKNGSTDAVRQFGQRMVDDHSKANDELKQLAAAKGVQLPMEPSSKMQREAKKLQGMSGAKFDHEYMEAMVDDHKEDVKEFRNASQNAKDPDVKAFAGKTLPVLEEHLQMAQQAYKMVKK